MAMREVDHGGIIRKPVVDQTSADYVATMAKAEANLNLNGTDTIVDRGGLTADPATQYYQGIEQAVTPNVGVNVKYVPPLPSNLIVDHGGITQPRTIVDDES
jgi:hypothetical protein